MDVGYFVIAILGCADGSTNCTPLATEPTHYASQASCSAATSTALLRNTDLDSPNLVAQCRKVEPASADRRPAARAIRTPTRKG